MSDSNPYAAPQFSGFQPPKAEAAPGGIYRQNNLLVMHKHAELPDVCVKSNQPANGLRLKRSLSWHHPGIYLALLANLLIYLVLALALRKQATIYIGLSELWMQKRRRSIIIGWSCFVIGIAMIASFYKFINAPPNAIVWLIPVGLVIALGGALYGSITARMVVAKRITDEYVWLKGVHPDFLAAQPVWDRTL